MLSLLSQLLVELFSSNGLSASELGRDVLSFEGLENFSHIGVLHGVDVFEEGNQSHKLFIVRIALPRFHDDGVFGLLTDMGGLGVEDDDLGKITIEV
jgi:hypothetical protein